MGFFLGANSLIVQKIAARQIVAFWRASRQTNRQKVHFRLFCQTCHGDLDLGAEI